MFEIKKHPKSPARRKLWLSALAAVALGVVLFGAALAQEPAPTPIPVTDDQVNALARQMYCPVCENTPLDVCPTQACAEWRELIREKLAEGWSERQIKDYFVLRFGDRVLATPPARGLNWLVYVVPPIAFLAGAFLLYRSFQSWRKPSPEAAIPPEPEQPVEAAYLARLEEELKQRQE